MLLKSRKSKRKREPTERIGQTGHSGPGGAKRSETVGRQCRGEGGDDRRRPVRMMIQLGLGDQSVWLLKRLVQAEVSERRRTKADMSSAGRRKVVTRRKRGAMLSMDISLFGEPNERGASHEAERVATDLKVNGSGRADER